MKKRMGRHLAYDTFGLVALFLLSGCATSQTTAPAQLPQKTIPAIVVPQPVKPVPSPAQPVAQPAQTTVTKDALSQKIIEDQGQVVEVTSVPAGATIALNDNIIGIAPGKFSVMRKPNRYGFLPRMTISAIPPEGSVGLYTQTKVFDGYTETPQHIHFTMSQPPPLPKLEGD